MSTRPGSKAGRLVARLAEPGIALSRAQIVADFGERALDAAVRSGEVVRILPGTYCAASAASDPLVRCRVVSTWAWPVGALTGVAALLVWGLPDAVVDRISVAMPQRLHRLAPGWIRVVRPAGSGRTFRVMGIRVVEAELAVVDAWNELDDERAVALVISAVRHRVADASRIGAALGLRARVRGRKRLVALLALLDGGVTSYLEYLARSRVFTSARFPYLQWQAPVRSGGRTRYLDAYDPEARIALEFDGRGTHDGDAARRSDIERDAEVAGIGILTLRFTYEDITQRPAWCIRTYLDARRMRHGTVAAPVGR